jgi:hypothetical protein
MATTSNPFEPPRTTDLDGDGGVATGTLALSKEALQELIAAAPWVRWLTRLMSVLIALGLVKAIRLVAIPGSAKAAALFSVAVGTAISTLILVRLRRYATALEHLRAGPREAAGQAIAAQGSSLRLLGVLAAVGIGLSIAIAVFALVVAGFGAFR